MEKRKNLRKREIVFEDPVPQQKVAKATSLLDEDYELQMKLTIARRQAPTSTSKDESFQDKDDERINPASGVPLALLSTKTVREKIDETPFSRYEAEDTYSNLNFAPTKDEPLVRRGVASTLAVLARRGVRFELFSPQNKREKGRLNTFTLAKYDADGNLLDEKEAYKVLSHKFHGKEPGKAKREKLMNRRKRPEAHNDFDSTAAMRKLQESRGTAHIQLEGSKALKPTTAPTAPNKSKPARPLPKLFGMQ